MSTTEMPNPTPPAGAACPRCGAPVRPDQDWCLMCGSAVTTEVAGARGWRTPVAVVGVVLALAAAGLLVAFLEVTDDADRVAQAPAPTPTAAAPALDTPVPTPTPTPTPTPIATPTIVIPTPTVSPVPGAAVTPLPGTTTGGAPGETPGASRTPTPFPTTSPAPATGTIASWPAGREAWTVILLSGNTKAAAEKKAREFQAQGKSVGVLHSDDYSSLRPGYWVVFSGQYDDKKAAQSAAEGMRSVAPQAYARLVKPK